MPDPKDELHHLFQAAGRTGPDRDLTDRIMARVAVTPLLRPTPVKPILGRGAWIGIIIMTVVVLVWGLLGSGHAEATDGPVSEALRTISATLPATGNWALWLAGLSASLLVLAAVDRALARRHRSA
ncbi:MAG: hypothetical protein ACK46G_08305 [Flavobacteriales bacterium]